MMTKAPLRTATAIVEHADHTAVTLSCGHVAQFSAHFHYRLGSEHRCYQCVNEALTASAQYD